MMPANDCWRLDETNKHEEATIEKGNKSECGGHAPAAETMLPQLKAAAWPSSLKRISRVPGSWIQETVHSVSLRALYGAKFRSTPGPPDTPAGSGYGSVGLGV